MEKESLIYAGIIAYQWCNLLELSKYNDNNKNVKNENFYKKINDKFLKRIRKK